MRMAVALLALVVGAVSVLVGVSMWSEPAAFVLGGLMSLWLARVAAQTASEKEFADAS